MDHAAASVMLTDEDAARARVYRLLSTLLTAPPSSEILTELQSLAGDRGTPLGTALLDISEMARTSTEDAVEDEYHDLFIGLGRGELLPYESYYLTGFLHEKPLARLREDMRRLGVASDPDIKEPEDHIASVLEIMSGLVEGTIGDDAATDQSKFFETHITPWVPLFFADLEKAQSARFYQPVARLGRAFLGIEADAFRMK